MCSRFLSLIAVLIATSQAPAQAPATQPTHALRIAADPNNLPFTNDKLEGFENKIAQLIADDLGEKIEYTWWAQRRGFFRDTLKHGDADIVMAVPTEFEKGTISSVPYMRSSFCFVYRKDRGLNVHSFDDAALKQLKIGVQLVGGANMAPPAIALQRRGLADNIVGYSLFSDYNEPNPPARVLDAVVSRDIDLAIVWGPQAGYYAKHCDVPLTVVPVSPQNEPNAPMTFDISIGIKRASKAMKPDIDRAIERNRAKIDALLVEYGVPRVPATTSEGAR